MRKFTKRSATVASAAVVAVGAAGAAWAFWGVTGTGSSSASAGEVKPLVVANDSIVLSPTGYFPGSKHSVTFTVKNPNPFPVLITSAVPANIVSSNPGACPSNSVVALPAQPTDSTALALPANSTAVQLTYNDAIKMIANPNEGCRTATFSFDIAVTAQSNASDS